MGTELTTTSKQTLTDGVKLQYIHDNRAVHRQWNLMDVHQKHAFLNGIEGTDERSLLKLARKVRKCK